MAVDDGNTLQWRSIIEMAAMLVDNSDGDRRSIIGVATMMVGDSDDDWWSVMLDD